MDADIDPDKVDDEVAYWLGELKRYEKEYGPWEDRCARIIKRYRDERQRPDGQVMLPARFNSLWSNVQTLSPAVYAKRPKPIAERRYLDRDQIGKYASMTLERALSLQLEVGYFHPSMQQAVLDYLLCGRGVLWERYEPTYGENKQGPDVSADENDPDEPKEVTYEKVCTDYVYWKDFRHSPVRFWDEVTWVAKAAWLSKKQGIERFGDKFKQVPMTDPEKMDTDVQRVAAYEGTMDRKPKALVWEIWNKEKREVIFIAPMYQTEVLEKKKDPLKLAGFWPCPKPLYATTSNDTLVPIPDYVEYQDQAGELDNLTARIAALTTAVKIAGCYDASIPALQRVLQEGADNKLVAVEDWAQFSQKGGIPGAISLIPLKDIVGALTELYNCRDRVKADMNEITGLSDIVRGQAQGNAATATEQRIKGQFASLRLQDRQSEVARFCRDAVNIAAEIIAEQFSPEILAQMTGILPHIESDLPEIAPPPPPMMVHNGGSPMQGPMQAAPMAQPNPGAGSPQPPVAPPGAPPPQGQPSPALAGAMPPPPSPEMIQQMRQKQVAQIYAQAVKLLKDDKMRTFRIDIETDSTIEVDAEMNKKASVEFLTAVGTFLQQAIPAGQMMPELVPVFGGLLQWGARQFRTGRDVESVIDQGVDAMEKKAKNPPPAPPNPETIKAQALIAQTQLDQQTEKIKQQGVIAKVSAESQAKQQELQMEAQINQQNFQIEQQRSALKLAELQAEAARSEREHQMEMEKMSVGIASTRHEAVIGGLEREHQHNLAMDVMDHKATQAKKPKPNGGK